MTLPTTPTVLEAEIEQVSVLTVPETTILAAEIEVVEVIEVVAEGPQGPPGSYNGPTIHVGPTPPSDTSLLWVDTSGEM